MTRSKKSKPSTKRKMSEMISEMAVVDVRRCTREVQEAAFEKGLIPYIPADRSAHGGTQ